MKFKTLAAAVALSVTLVGCGEEEASTTDVAMQSSAPVETLEQRVSYLMGLQFGQQLSGGEFEINQDALKAGMNDGLNGFEQRLTEEQITATLAEFQTMMEAQQMAAQQEAEATLASQSAENEAAGIAFLAENGARPEVITTESGLQYEVLQEGAGAQPTANDVVTVNYKGTFLDGSVFDDSSLHGGPATFGLDQVISGWTEGVALMNVGAKYKLYIPYNLAYGENGSMSIPPKSTLIFEVELLEIAE